MKDSCLWSSLSKNSSPNQQFKKTSQDYTCTGKNNFILCVRMKTCQKVLAQANPNPRVEFGKHSKIQPPKINCSDNFKGKRLKF